MFKLRVWWPFSRGWAFRPFYGVPSRFKNTVDWVPKKQHEIKHLNRQPFLPFFWAIKYFTNSVFRWQEEKVAWAEEIRLYAKINIKFNITYLANVLVNSYTFFGRPMCSKSEAIKFLKGLK